MQSRKLVSLVDIAERSVPNSGGKKEKYVLKGKTLMLDVGIVGQNTFWNAQLSNILLSYSIKIRALLFDNQKWCYFDNSTYEIVNLGKTQNTTFILLNVKEHNDDSVKKAIQKWLGVI